MKLSYSILILATYLPAICLPAVASGADAPAWRDLEHSIQPATAEGMPRVRARFGMGYEFNGRDHLLKLKPTIGIGGDFTVECWIKPSRRTPRATLLSSAAWSKFQLTLREGREIKLQLRGKNGSFRIQGEYDFAPNTWHHIVAVYDQAEGGRIYVNGRLCVQSGDDSRCLRRSLIFP